MPEQPVPSASREDVERIVRRDYPAARVDEVFAVLKEYGDGAGFRVQLACLKCAAGNIATSLPV